MSFHTAFLIAKLESSAFNFPTVVTVVNNVLSTQLILKANTSKSTLSRKLLHDFHKSLNLLVVHPLPKTVQLHRSGLINGEKYIKYIVELFLSHASKVV